MKSDVYWDLNRGCYAVHVAGAWVCFARSVMMRDVEFVVEEKVGFFRGKVEALTSVGDNLQKSPIEGIPAVSLDYRMMPTERSVQVSYNPYRDRTFVAVDQKGNRTPILEAQTFLGVTVVDVKAPAAWALGSIVAGDL